MIKAVAADPALLHHRGPAVTFEDQADLEARIDDPDLPVTPDSVLVLKRGGPVGAPGMPEWGMLPIPRRLLEAGVRDMVRISDSRMSGTSYGTCVLHVAPEAAVGGPLAFVRDGDEIELDVAGRRLDLLISEAELARRRADFEDFAPERAERLRRAVRAARDPGQPRLRLRVSAAAHGGHGAGDPLAPASSARRLAQASSALRLAQASRARRALNVHENVCILPPWRLPISSPSPAGHQW